MKKNIRPVSLKSFLNLLSFFAIYAHSISGTLPQIFIIWNFSSLLLLLPDTSHQCFWLGLLPSASTPRIRLSNVIPREVEIRFSVNLTNNFKDTNKQKIQVELGEFKDPLVGLHMLFFQLIKCVHFMKQMSFLMKYPVTSHTKKEPCRLWNILISYSIIV